MNAEHWNIHATAIVVDGRGLLFVGPSGSGKSSMAFDCLVEARISGKTAALIADDRVIISLDAQGRVQARRPETIAGLLELRHSGIVRMPSQAEGFLHLAIMPVDPNSAERLPPEDEHVKLVAHIAMPLIRIPTGSTYPLARIEALVNRI